MGLASLWFLDVGPGSQVASWHFFCLKSIDAANPDPPGLAWPAIRFYASPGYAAVWWFSTGTAMMVA